jgi:glycosyltransferase involved in cell wall biosynthesis
MKVLKIIHTQGHGGAENTFRWLAWGLRRKGVEVIAAVPEVGAQVNENWIAPALEEAEVPYLTFDKTGSPGQLLKNIGAVIERVRPDIVHSHLLDSNFYSSIACRLKSVPHVCTEHGDVSINKTAVSRVKYGIISLCSRLVICVSESVRESASRAVLIKSRLKTVYNGIHFMENKHSSFREEFGIPDGAVLIGNVGNLYPVKGQAYLIRAFAELYSLCPLAVLAIVGRGGEENRLRQLANDLNIPANRIVFTGFRNDIENVMNAFDLYVQPSLSEGHPIAVIEAMSLGIPVIASAVGGIPEIIGEDCYGRLVIPGVWEDLLQVMQEYFVHDETFLEKAHAARSYARDAFSIERMASNYIDVYRQVLPAHGERTQVGADGSRE